MGVNDLKNELSIMSTLDHPNIVKLIDVYDSRQGFHMIEVFCLGCREFMCVNE